MELTWGLLLLMTAMGGFALFWHDTLGARDLANDAARQTCASNGAALLDGTVAFHRLRVVRGDQGRAAFERTYLFDYSSDGVTRRQGWVVVCNRRVESVGLQ
ncbi:MAG TPA: DUF3301 domain-containing protein [Steroidobacteraceae bacterium]|nr:DUF3301 domain-containing protein [Steroidobacteraceae bacterium]